MKINNRGVSLIFVIALLCSCTVEKAEPNVQWFRLTNRNTLKTYNIDFTLRISRAYEGSELPLKLVILSPTGKRYLDTLRIPVNKELHNHSVSIIESGVWSDIVWHYRKDASFPEVGKWLFAIHYISPQKKRGMVDGLEIMIK